MKKEILFQKIGTEEKIDSYEILKKRVRAARTSGISHVWRGFLSYEFGYKFLGIKPREKAGQNVPAGGCLDMRAALSREIYFSKIEKIKEYLRAGETYQVNFSYPFYIRVPPSFSASQFFHELSSRNPSPHPFFYENDNFAVISNSPELLVRGYWISIPNGSKKFIIETRPIKGTVPRGRTPEEDELQIQKLLASKKEEAELTMIVDLERNDLGKVCKPGTVRIVQHRAIEKYSHVIHTASVVQGELEDGKDVFDVLEAVFPGGSVTGCPKKRTMEIIDELEDTRRGVYCGSAGTIEADGSFEFNIMIRTAFLDKQTGLLTFRSGGGIVIDSDPEKEYEETLHKAAAFFESMLFFSSSHGDFSQWKIYSGRKSKSFGF